MSDMVLISCLLPPFHQRGPSSGSGPVLVSMGQKATSLRHTVTFTVRLLPN